MTEPKGPVYICLDTDVQEAKIDKPMIVPHAQFFRPPPGPAANPGIVAQRGALARRGAVAGDRRRRSRTQSESAAADVGPGRGCSARR